MGRLEYAPRRRVWHALVGHAALLLEAEVASLEDVAKVLYAFRALDRPLPAGLLAPLHGALRAAAAPVLAGAAGARDYEALIDSLATLARLGVRPGGALRPAEAFAAPLE